MGSMKSLLDLEEALGGGGICTPSKNKFYPFLRICVTTSERGGGEWSDREWRDLGWKRGKERSGGGNMVLIKMDTAYELTILLCGL